VKTGSNLTEYPKEGCFFSDDDDDGDGDDVYTHIHTIGVEYECCDALQQAVSYVY
jgi:hypothetical protein